MLKILLLAVFVAFICRNSKDDKEANEYLDDNQIDLDNNKEDIYSTKVCPFFCYEINENLFRRNH